MELGNFFDLFHGFSLAVITSIIVMSMGVAFLVFRYFENDAMDRSSWND
jgi:hypothetical protein